MSELSFAADIGPLFRERDVKAMQKISGWDLSSYEDVKERADEVHSRLADGTMPCDEPWPEDQVAKFKSWVDQGMAP